MFSISPATRVFVATRPADLRLGFDGLSGWVKNHLRENPVSGHLFLFTNKRRNRLKALYWDGSGLWLCTKRLERGAFAWPAQTATGAAALRPEQLQALLHGLVLNERQKWLRL